MAPSGLDGWGREGGDLGSYIQVVSGFHSFYLRLRLPNS